MKTIILDLDNCISDDHWRIPLIRFQESNIHRRYHEYHSGAAKDSCANRHLFDDIAYDIAILTSRPVLYREQTIVWLMKNDIKFNHLIMRNVSDHRTSALVKSEQALWLTQYYNVPLKDIVCAYDDKPEVVSAYKEMGIPAEIAFINDLHPHLSQATGKGFVI